MKRNSQNKKSCQLIIDRQYDLVFIVLPWVNPFIRSLISRIKSLRYNEELNACEAPIRFADLIEHLASLYFDEIIIDEYDEIEETEKIEEDNQEQSGQPEQPEQSKNDWVMLGDLLTKDDIHSIRKLLSTKYHPDHHPTDLNLMCKLNAIFDKLEAK